MGPKTKGPKFLQMFTSIYMQEQKQVLVPFPLFLSFHFLFRLFCAVFLSLSVPSFSPSMGCLICPPLIYSPGDSTLSCPACHRSQGEAARICPRTNRSPGSCLWMGDTEKKKRKRKTNMGKLEMLSNCMVALTEPNEKRVIFTS